MRRSSVPVIQQSRIFGEGHSGGGGTMKFSRMGESSSQSVWSHLRYGGAGSRHGDVSRMVMGT